jgi:hypothetical protein
MAFGNPGYEVDIPITDSQNVDNFNPQFITMTPHDSPPQA